MTTPAYFVVFTQPSASLDESLFHAWYDSEHIPLRKSIPGILNISRLVHLDDLEPSFATVYHLADPSVLRSDAYTSLANNRSQLEKHVISNLHVLERRLFVLNEHSRIRCREGIAEDDYTPAPVTLFVSLQVEPGIDSEKDFHAWYEEEHIALLQLIPGWRRSRRFVLLDAAARSPASSTPGYTPVERPPQPRRARVRLRRRLRERAVEARDEYSLEGPRLSARRRQGEEDIRAVCCRC